MEIFGQILVWILLAGLVVFAIYEIVMLVRDIRKKVKSKKEKDKESVKDNADTDRKE